MSLETSATNLATPWRFRDGTEYLVSIRINDKPKWVSLSLSDKVTAEEWSGQYDLTYIENLTQRTGNYKPFDTFVMMIKCAILKKSDSVTLELMSYEDLVALRNQKKRTTATADGGNEVKELNIGPNLSKFDGSSETEFSRQVSQQQQQGQGSSQPNKYLIITYVAEFDKVHYPLPLKYTGYPDAIVMQHTIQKLKTEVSTLKNANMDLITQLKTAVSGRGASAVAGKRQQKSNYKNSTNNPNNNNNKRKIMDNNDVDSSGFDSPFEGDVEDYPASSCSIAVVAGKKEPNEEGFQLEKLQSLAAIVRRLESRIEGERDEHQDKLTKLQAENEYLQNKLKSLESSECTLKEKVTRLESVLALNVGIKKRASTGAPTIHYLKRSSYVDEKEITPQSSYVLRSSGSQTRQQQERPPGRRGSNHRASNDRNPSYSSRCSSVGSKCSRQSLSLPRDEAKKSSGGRVAAASPSSRRNSSERIRPFNPTEYVKQKKEKQERLAQMRMAKLESRLHYNYEPDNRCRSTSKNPQDEEEDEDIMSPAVSRGSTALKSWERSGGTSNFINNRLNRQPSDESQQHQRQRPPTNGKGQTKSHNLITRQAHYSPSPVRQAARHDPSSKLTERQSRRKTRDKFKPPSLDELLNSRRSRRDKEDDLSHKTKDSNNSLKKSDRRVREPRKIESSLSFEKLQRRLHTIHAFLEMNKNPQD